MITLGCAVGVVLIGLRRATALLLYHPVNGRYVTTGFVAEGPAWGTNISGMSSIERTAPQEITVWCRNAAGETATMRYLWEIRGCTTRCTRKACSSPG